ncbi:GNAT family N-acetyltransferase [Psychrobacillus sp. NEAU-3TGS]|uniref:GNAT family N-acetyltransferase n=1 Tax=Psychrobacillus sp. NEAU-3TGS TaxID=2995412 RepID=UPI0024991750|nr:GNAT family N-acetyltransferase [Psychrobacillus sp. NEAU-3TGS]MDI2587418.1 GNAT family N-acetyltransferase [Psychrobacillus sp. NEAU-3TGS]
MKEWTGKLGEKDYIVRVLKEDSVEDILRLQDLVLETLINNDFLSPVTKEEYEDFVSKSLMVGVFVEDKLVAFRALAIPEIDEHHLGYDIGLQREQLNKVVYQEITNVHPDYRGYGLQKKLGAIVMELLDASPYTHVCATVAPFNIASLKDKLSQGMVIGALKNKYADMLRYVFYKKLHGDRKIGGEALEIRMADTEKQQLLLADGWIGTSIVQKDGEWYVTYEEKGIYM